MSVDLHIHSKNSDGELDLENSDLKEIFNDYDFFSITDHDFIFNPNNYKKITDLKMAGKKIISGVEICCNFDGVRMEVLGYNFNPNDETINNTCKKIVDIRYAGMVKTLNDKNLNIKDIHKNPFQTNVPLPEDINEDEFWKEYIKGEKTKTYDQNNALEIIRIIKNAGGTPVLAHPLETLKGKSENYIDEFISELNLKIIELYTTKHNLDDVNLLKKIIEKRNLSASIGSDSHFIPLEKIDFQINYKDKIFDWFNDF